MIKTTVIRKKRTDFLKTKDIKKIAGYISDKEGYFKGEIIVTIVDDKVIKEINRDYLNKDKSTNVITFSYIDDFDENISPVLSEIFINVDAAAREAKAVEISTKNRAFQLIIHGLLHGFGYEHVGVDDETAGKMIEKEILYYKKLNEILKDE